MGTVTEEVVESSLSGSRTPSTSHGEGIPGGDDRDEVTYFSVLGDLLLVLGKSFGGYLVQDPH